MSRWEIRQDIKNNSFEYFESTLLSRTGFREYDVRWRLGSDVNPNGFVVLGRAYATYLARFLKIDTVVVGHDFRAYSQELARSFVLGLLSAGANVVDIGLALTPMVYFAQHLTQTRGGAMITASHNENGWTGVKLANGLSSTLGPEEVLQLRNIAEAGDFEVGIGSYHARDDIFEQYASDVVSGLPLSGRPRVVVAAGNGTAGRFAPSVLRALGCDVVELDCAADWDFPNHNPNPEDIAFLEAIGAATQQNNAAVGLGFDGDGDRLGVVDNHGKEVFSDKLGLVIARHICGEHPGRSIVVDVKSTGLFLDDPLLRNHHCPVVMCKTGHSYVKQAVASSNAIAGFEKSGHFFFNSPRGRGYDDALLSAAVVLRMLDKTRLTLSELVDALPKTWQSPTLGAYCADVQKYEVVDAMIAQYQQNEQKGIPVAGSRIKEIILTNGIRFVLESGGWGVVRASSNKPSIVLVAESRTSQDELHDIIDDIKAQLLALGGVCDYDQPMPPRR